MTSSRKDKVPERLPPAPRAPFGHRRPLPHVAHQRLSLSILHREVVKNTVRLSSRGVFVVHGRIIDGTISRGQRVHRPPGLDAPVAGVEFVLLSASEGRENPALTFKYRDEAQLARGQALDLMGQTLELEDGDVSSGAP